MALLASVILEPDTRANQPAANSVAVGTLYSVSDEDNIVERSNGTTWDPYSPTVGAGTVTNSGTLTADMVILGNGTTVVKALAAGTAGQVLTMNAGATAAEWASPSGGGTVVQIVNTQTGAVATGTTLIPDDDTIPQNTEGTEFMTLAVTPTDAANKLKIDVVFNGGNSTANLWMTVCLFQDSTANALAVGREYNTVGTAFSTIGFSHVMTAGTTSATTFKVRAGSESSGTVTFNGQGGARKMGGVFASSITITEYVP